MDTKGKLKGLLYYLRRFEYCKDIVILISERTGQDYRQYLKERNYGYFICRDDKVDYHRSLKFLRDKLDAETVFVDAGPTLNRILLEKGLIDEISLLVHPVLTGKMPAKLLKRLNSNKNIKLKLIECKAVNGEYALLNYEVVKQA